MTPNFYFNNFLIRDRDNKVFTFSPDLEKCKKRFTDIIKPTVEFLELNAEITTDGNSAKEILEKIYEGINKSRILLFDLSKDDRYNNGVNPNVAYELGIARSIRDDKDILLITDIADIEREIFFDIRGMNIKKITNDFNKRKLQEILESICEKQKYYEDKRVEAISKLVDGDGIHLMYRRGRIPQKYNSHFNSRHIPSGINISLADFKMTCLRLLDLGIAKTEYKCYKNGFEYAYHWTNLGKAVMKHMGINEMAQEEFESSPFYQEYLQEESNYKEDKKKFIE
jgi:hypothetical protein